ncbi:hypothetical protein ACMAY6_01840 [Luminiphilus sp. nBUS_16]|uniref:hypothetical protein n=1 Tax=Luminiphilus sp. nBUS_16 TaxID=3395315 RepID=UPI003EBA2EFF
MVADSAEPKVTLLKRVTLDYSPDEDRMKLTGLTQEGVFVVAWLSLRLLGRVVPHLLTRYESIATSAVANAPSLQQSSQSGASGGEEPVVSAHGTPSFLVGAADISQGTDAIVLTLRGGLDEVRFAIPAAKMALWLSGLKNLYQVAEWPMTIWQDADKILVSSQGGGSVTLH